MPFKDTVTADEYNGIQESDRSLYIKKAGENGAADTYTLHPSVIAERTALSTKNTQILAEKKAAADALKPFTELGLDPTKIKEIVDAHQAAEAAKLTDKQREEAAVTNLKTAHQQETERLKTTAKEREDFLTRELRRNMIDAVASLAIKDAGGQVEPLLPHIIAAMDIQEDGEGDAKRFVTRVIGDDKAPRYVGSEFMTPVQLVEEFKKKEAFAGLFAASGKGGSGAPQQRRGAPTIGNTTTLSSTQKIEQGLSARR